MAAGLEGGVVEFIPSPRLKVCDLFTVTSLGVSQVEAPIP